MSIQLDALEELTKLSDATSKLQDLQDKKRDQSEMSVVEIEKQSKKIQAAYSDLVMVSRRTYDFIEMLEPINTLENM